jgi:uncharacterized membrane protein
VEYIFLIALLILAVVANNRTSALRGQIEKLEETIRALAERLAAFSAPPKAATAAAAADAAPAATAAAESTPEVIRSEFVAESPPAPPVSEPTPTAPETVPAEQPPAANLDDIPERFRDEPLPQGSIADTGEAQPSLPPPPEPPTAEPEPSRPNFSDLEKRFGTQWVVWVGGFALALGGILLVRYSIEQGLFGPGLRIAAGAVLALVLVGLGELARRKEDASDIDQMPRAHIPSILTAAGTTVAYADIWAAYEIYKFLSPALAFLLLGLVALGTLAAALKHGPALGGLGLVGAYVTPLLVSTTQPSYWTLYVYLTVVTAAAYALARFRMWRWLAITAAVFSVLWTFAGMGDLRPGSMHAHAFAILAGFALAAVFLVPGLVYGPDETRGKVGPVSSGVLAGYLVAAFALVLVSVHANTSLITMFVLAAATAVIAWRSDAAILAVPVAAALAALVIVHWAVNFNFQILFTPSGPFYGAPPTWTISGRGQHLLFAAGTAAVFGGMGYWAQERSARLEFSMLWAACAVLTPIVIMIALYYSLASYGRSIPFAIMAVSLAAVFALASLQLWQREEREGIREAGAIFATGAVAALALALTFALEKGWLTVALALMVPGIALIADKQPMPILRNLCGAIILLVMARIALDPRIVGDHVGKMPIFNWLLWGYGAPAVSFWLAGKVLRRRADDVPARMADSAAILFTALTFMLEIRHLMNDGDIFRPSVGLGEAGLQISIWIAMAIGFEHQRARSGSIIHDAAARIFGGLALVGILVALVFRENPLFTGAPVGGPFFNYILLGYGIPAVLMAILARFVRFTRPQGYYFLCAATAIVLMLAYLTLEVRTLFHGPVLNAPFISDAEHYTYSVVWLGFGVALLLIGIALKSQPARLASAAVVILDTFKVFFIDLGNVQGLYRALSFICLGLVLMGIGWLYQRLLFPARKATAPETAAAPSG